jgi:hypothetical protein
LGNIGKASGNNSLAKAAGDINRAIGTAKTIGKNIDTINKGLATIAAAKDPRQTLSGLTSIIGAVGKTGSALGAKDLAKTTASLGKVTTNASKLLSAASSLATSKNINQTLGAVGSIISSANNIAGAFSKNSKSTGLVNMPGGQLSVGSLVNKSLGSMGIPKNAALGSVITNAVTSAINNVAYPKAAQAATAGLQNLASGAGLQNLAGGISNAASNAVSALQSGVQGLASMTLGKMSAAAAGPLSAALASIGFGGASAIKMPSIGINTNDVAAVNAQINAILDDPRIPKPDFGDVDEGAIALLESTLQQNAQVDSMLDQIDSLIPGVEQAREEYFNLENSLPPGDPQIAQAREQWVEMSNQLQQALDSIDLLIGDDTNSEEA